MCWHGITHTYVLAWQHSHVCAGMATFTWMCWHGITYVLPSTDRDSPADSSAQPHWIALQAPAAKGTYSLTCLLFLFCSANHNCPACRWLPTDIVSLLPELNKAHSYDLISPLIPQVALYLICFSDAHTSSFSSLSPQMVAPAFSIAKL